MVYNTRSVTQNLLCAALTDQQPPKDYQLHVERRPDFLLVRVTGTNSAETVMQYLQDVYDECHRQDCFRVLIDEQLAGPRLDVSEVYSIASDGSMSAMGVYQAIAYVDQSMGEIRDFLENVAVNRGLPIRTFGSVEAAESWLSGQTEGSDEKTLFEEHNSRNRFR